MTKFAHLSLNSGMPAQAYPDLYSQSEIRMMLKINNSHTTNPFVHLDVHLVLSVITCICICRFVIMNRVARAVEVISTKHIAGIQIFCPFYHDAHTFDIMRQINMQDQKNETVEAFAFTTLNTGGYRGAVFMAACPFEMKGYAKRWDGEDGEIDMFAQAMKDRGILEGVRAWSSRWCGCTCACPRRG